MRCWGDDNTPQGEYPEGVSPSGRFFGDFLIGEKVTRGADHGKAMISRSACHGVAGAKSDDLLPRGLCPLAKRLGCPTHPSVERKNYSSKKYAAPATSASCRRHSRQSGKNRSTSRQKAALWS